MHAYKSPPGILPSVYTNAPCNLKLRSTAVILIKSNMSDYSREKSFFLSF